MMMESSPTTIAPVLLRNILSSIIVFADKSLLTISEKHRLLQLLRYLIISAFLFCLRLLPSFLSFLTPSPEDFDFDPYYSPKHSKSEGNYQAASAAAGVAGESSIGRALSQLLSIVNDLPVSSRKYDVVRSLAERLIDENLADGGESLREINCAALSIAFSRALVQLEAAVIDRDHGGAGAGDLIVDDRTGLNRVVKAVRYYGDVAWTRFGRSSARPNRTGSSAEKMAAELLWLARKLAACGFAEEAVLRWASASNLAWLSLSAEPRLQGSLVKVSAFLLKEAKDMGIKEDGEESKNEQNRQTRMKMLTSWLPLLCRASNGTDVPVLSSCERAELEKVLEDMIGTLETEEEQEKVLSLWLHHFTYCQSSDWPNLHACYARWCADSRKLLLLH